MEAVEIPEYIDNCISHCPKGILGPKEVARLCISKECPGPIVQDRIVDISETGSDDDTATTRVKVCGADMNSLSYDGLRPTGYMESQGDDVNILNDETVLVHEFTQEELRQE